MSIDIASLGITNEELQQRLIDRLVEHFTTTTWMDEDGEPSNRGKSEVAKRIEDAVVGHVNRAVEKIAAETVGNPIESYLAGMTIKTTNSYGEPKGPTVTFVEYLAKQAGEYLNTQVDKDGKPKASQDSYSWKPESTRAMWLVNRSMQSHIVTVMNECLTGHNQKIGEAIADSVRLAIDGVRTNFKITTATTTK